MGTFVLPAWGWLSKIAFAGVEMMKLNDEIQARLLIPKMHETLNLYDVLGTPVCSAVTKKRVVQLRGKS